MNIQQMRFVREVIRQNFNLTEASRRMFTSQPGVSKAIIEFEEELGVDIFRRHAKRIRGLTEAGEQIAKTIDSILLQVERLKGIGHEFYNQNQGQLTIATTHTQARYVLPPVIAAFTKRYPDVRLSILQSDPAQIAQLLREEKADIGIATESLSEQEGLLTLPGYTWQHYLVAPKGHAILSKEITLEVIAKEPLITYSHGFAGRSRIDEAFAGQGLTPNIVLQAIDADVVKTYVEMGLGIGIIAEVAYLASRDIALSGLPVGHLFGEHVTKIAIKKGAYLRSYVKTFIELFAPELSHAELEETLSTQTSYYNL